MYDEFSQNDPQKYTTQGALNPPKYSTSYTLSDEETGITLNGNTAKYIVLSGSKITANNRIAIDGNAGDWRFNYGLRAPDNGKWANFSICNLKEGDRVVFSYTGTPPVFASEAGETAAPEGPYNGSKAFFDQYNDGTFDEGEDVYITPGATPLTDWHRGEGNFYMEDHQGQQGNAELYYTRYVITEDGHLDLAIAPDTRIVKIKIFSDHQASMVDEYDADSYTAKFDITGELQAMEHIVPGGLEVHVGANEASQHAQVVYSAHGPVSVVNGVNGYKLPGMTLDDNGNPKFEFDLANNIPETGTFYKFMPLEDGKMTITFQAASMNYYSYGLDGDAVYYGNVSSYNDGNWTEEFDRPNEQTRNVSCPYYLVKVDENSNKTVIRINNRDYLNGAEITYRIPGDVKVGETYYLYGGWNNASNLYYNGSGQGRNNLEYFPFGDGNGGKDNACGVAKLLKVVFNPNKKIYPLAKWVPNGTTEVKTGSGVPNPRPEDGKISYDSDKLEYELADLYGYNDRTSITVKKMLGNITACHPFLQRVQGNHYKLMIDGIEFAENKDKGGTILIKIGDATQKSSPVFALTIAYSGDPQFDGNSGQGTRGHIWDYSSNDLKGLDYNPNVITQPRPGVTGVYESDAATPISYGQYFADYFGADISNYSSKDEVLAALPTSGSGLLYDEIAGGASDWMFNYNLVNAGKLYDPMFTNKYDLEGDNADLIWNTEGTVMLTSANASVMFNEFKGNDIHQSTTDPERYVGILTGGEFRIPWLMPNDRVIIYMGTGKGAFNDQAVFSITNAYDAVHNEIDPEDDYVVGGSKWNYSSTTIEATEEGEEPETIVNDDRYYRGCYHFFATGDQNNENKPADMIFKMKGGTVCKIYSIQIYRGDRIITNEIVGETEDDNKYLLWSQAADPNDESAEDYLDENHYNWTLKYLGKDQQLANGTGKYSQENEIIAQTGKFEGTPALTVNLTDAEDETSPVKSFTYMHQLREIGTFRMRAKDMEKKMNYVADYADHNVTIAYQQTQPYPYTWDFSDVTGFEGNVASLFEPEEKLGEEDTAPEDVDADAWDNLDAASYQKTARDLSLWEVNVTSGDYFLRLNSQSSQTLDNLMPQDNIFETAKEIGGNQVWANGTIIPEMQGILFYTENNNQNNGEWTLIAPTGSTPGGLDFTGSSSLFKKIVVPNVPADAAVYLRLTKIADEPVFKYMFGEGTLADITNSETAKFYQVGTGNDYIVAMLNTNDSKSNLTFALNGYRIQKLAVSEDFKKLDINGWASESRARVIDPELTSFLTGENIETLFVTDVAYGDPGKSGTLTLANPIATQVLMANTDGETGACLLHNAGEQKGPVEILNGGFHLFVPDMHDYTANSEKNLKTPTTKAVSLLKAQVTEGDVSGENGSYTNYVLTSSYYENGKTKKTLDDDAFYRVSGSVHSKGNQAYLPLLTANVKIPGSSNSTIFFFEGYQPVDGISEVSTDAATTIDAYTIGGQKLQSLPKTSGLYIINGKKVVIK